MTRPHKKHRFAFKNVRPHHPGVKGLQAWPPANRGFYQDFRQWLRAGGYSEHTLHLYCSGVRFALGFLDKPYGQIDPAADLDRVRAHMETCAISATTRDAYHKGLAKLAQYLHARGRRPPAPQPPHWDYYLATLPAWLQSDVRDYLAHCRRGWLVERHDEMSRDLLSHLTLALRWLVTQVSLHDWRDVTPQRWYDYVDMRLTAGISARTLNAQLEGLHSLVRFVADQADRPICQRLLLVEKLAEGPRLPRDVPVGDLQRLRQAIETAASAGHASVRRRGIMDRAWFLLMVHSGLRVGEVRRLRMQDLNLDDRWVRIEQSKGLKDRNVCLSPATVAALRTYFEQRAPVAPASAHVFMDRHLPLSRKYCNARLRTYGKPWKIAVTAHQLRHSCGTLLLNAGAPLTSIQALLGHENIETTLIYAHAYDPTVAGDYYRAMAQVEAQLALADTSALPPGPAQLLTFVDTLDASALNDAQRETVQALRRAILAMAIGPTSPP